MMIKGISFTSIWLQNDDQRNLLYFDNLELKWWSRGSPLPQSGFAFWNDDQGDFLYLNLDLLYAKSWNFKLDFNWQVLHCCTIFEMSDFYLLILDLNFIKISLIDKILSFEKHLIFETMKFWNFILNFETLELRNFYLKSGT